MNRSMLMLACFVLGASTACAGADIREFEFSFDNGDVSLNGTVIMPSGEGPHPGMVMVGGSGPSGRSQLVEVAEGFAREGMAVLAYDKRGTGQSGGNWVNSSLFDLADDAAAAFRALVSHPAIDPEKIGYWGISQGGWIVPIAASRTPAAFAIVVSGGGLAPKEVETHNYLSILERLDSGEQAQYELRHLLEEYFAYLAGVGCRQSLMETLETYRNRAWLSATGIEKVIPSEANRENWAWVADFEPSASIAAMTVPVLVLLGGSDPLTPAKRTAEAWRSALPGKCSNCKVTVLADAGHGLRSGPHGGPLVPGFYSRHLRWLASLNILAPPRLVSTRPADQDDFYGFHWRRLGTDRRSLNLDLLPRPRRRSDWLAAAAALPRLTRGQLHCRHGADPVPADRRAQVRQAHPRSHHPRGAFARRGGTLRAGIDGFDHAQQHHGGAAHRAVGLHRRQRSLSQAAGAGGGQRLPARAQARLAGRVERGLRAPA